MNSSAPPGSFREIDSDRATDVASVGTVLLRSREQQSFTRQQAADELNLRLDQLDSLERGHYDQLPGDAFVRGYIRNYAKWLGMDADKMVENYILQSGVANEVSQSAGLAAKAPVSRVNHSGRILAAGLVVTTLILGFWLYNSGDEDATDAEIAAGEISVDTFSGKPLEQEQAADPAADWKNPFSAASSEKNADAEAQAENSEQLATAAAAGAPRAAATAPQPTAEQRPPLQQSDASSASPTSPNTTTVTTASPSSTTVASRSEPSAAIEQAPAQSDDASIPMATIIDSSTIEDSAVVLDADEAIDESVDRGPDSVIRGSGSDQLIFFFSDECWVQVTEASGKIMFSAMRYAGQSLILNGKKPFELRVGNAPAVDLTLNGERIEVRSRNSSGSARMNLGEEE